MKKEENALQKASKGKERRIFLKKAIYSAPALVTMGSMTRAYSGAGSELVPCPPNMHRENGVCVSD